MRLNGSGRDPTYRRRRIAGPRVRAGRRADCGRGGANGERGSGAGGCSAAGGDWGGEGATRQQIKTIQSEAADILEFQAAMLEDDALTDTAYEVIAIGIAADHAWRRAST